MRDRLITILLFLLCLSPAAQAQRKMDKLDRGLVAMPSRSSGIFVSWRILGEEYYDVTYNLYRNGSRIATGLTASNYDDAGGTTSSQYQVAAVVRGVEQQKCTAVTPWTLNDGTNRQKGVYYTEIPIQHVTDRNGTDVNGEYHLNDICMADLNGDGTLEFIVKRPCSAAMDMTQNTRFHVVDCYDLHGNRLWWIDMGPNMQSGADEQWDVAAFDWDQDGRAELLFRGADNMIIHHADGTTTNIGNMSVDNRSVAYASQPYINTGAEYLIYANGLTAKPYWVTDYPIARGDDQADWGKGILGHRSTKHFIGAPFLDGRKPSIFLGRGIYTKTICKAFDVDPATHQITERWHWQNTRSGSPWFGQGYHNFAIADVDLDGRDEIVYGSMVIDDTGNGLSTSGLGHGDAQHCADHDPFRWGLEQFCCNEDNPAMNYRNATTSELYYRQTASGDDGRGLMANFTNQYPGSVGRSVTTGMISSVADCVIEEIPDFIAWGDLNFRIYWDGDLCSEVLNSPGSDGKSAKVEKPGQGRMMTTIGITNNSSKNNPCYSADILGDWREEILLRHWNNECLLIYSTNYPTQYRIPTLWHDHHYRNAMLTQQYGYNQPPHLSYFLGELEDFTIAPPPLTNEGRTEIYSGGTIPNEDKHFLFCPSAGGNSNVTIQDGASPYIVTFNIPTWVRGRTPSDTNSSSSISWMNYSCTVHGGALTGATRVVKQGDGALHLPAVDMPYTGPTDVWGGTVYANGSLTGTDITLHPHTNFHALGSTYKSVTARYNGRLTVGGEGTVGTVSIGSLDLRYGGTLELDYVGGQLDQVNLGTLRVERKTWSYGPKYSRSVLRVNGDVPDGSYTIGTLANPIQGQFADLLVEMSCGKVASVEQEDETGRLMLHVGNAAVAGGPSGGTYYIQNVATGLFLSGGSWWGTHAVVSDHALDWDVTLSDGIYTLDSKLSNGGNNHFLATGEDLYTDGGAGHWNITKVSAGIYFISYGEGDARRAVTAPTEGDLVMGTATTEDNTLAQWRLLTYEQMMEAMTAGASEQHPTDATWLVRDPGFGRNNTRNGAWTWNFLGSSTNHNINGDPTNYCAESWHAAFRISQTLTGLPNGVYRVSCQGFYRPDSGSGNDHACLYAQSGDEQVRQTLCHISEGSTVPNSMTDASLRFTAGEYRVAPVEITVTDGTLVIGILAEGVTNDWNIFDNFEVSYLGVSLKSLLREAIAAAQRVADENAAQTGPHPFQLTEEGRTALLESIDAQRTLLEAETLTENDLNNARQALQEAAENYLAVRHSIVSGRPYYLILAGTDGQPTGLHMNLSHEGEAQTTVTAEPYAVRLVQTGSNYFIENPWNGHRMATASGNNSAWGNYPAGTAIQGSSDQWAVEPQADGTIRLANQNSTFRNWGWHLGALAIAEGGEVSCYKWKATPVSDRWFVRNAPHPEGDVDEDWDVDMDDLALLTSIVFGQSPYRASADLNSDSRASIGDLTRLIHILMQAAHP